MTLSADRPRFRHPRRDALKVRPAMPFAEFVAMVALLFASVAFAIDAMLPLITQMGRELAPEQPAQAQLVITLYVAGLGLGTFVAGPLSDALGRRRVILGGIGLYMIAASVAALSGSMTTLLVARFAQGLATAGPRVAAQALVRDLYSGPTMARVMSLAMALFVLVPAVAPLIGAWIADFYGWRAIFWAFVIFGVVSGGWLALRQPETLPPERRRPLQPARLAAALTEVLGHARVRLYLIALTLGFATMFVWLSSLARVFEDSFDRGAEFPVWFAMVALLSAPASLLNARLVMRLGMMRLVFTAFGVQVVAACGLLALLEYAPADWHFPGFMLFMWLQFAAVALTFGNLNALALEPMGHIAGMAASVMGGFSTLAAALIATGLVSLGDGTPVPLALATLGCATCALLAMLRARSLQARAAQA